MRRFRLVAFVAPLLAALACRDATSPQAVTRIHPAPHAQLISSAWTATGAMPSSGFGHTATLLPNGKVLVAGAGFFSSAAVLYDPTSNTWLPTASMATIRVSHTATLLGNGKVLVAGGANFGGTLASAELYDPNTGLWTSAGSMPNVRVNHTATMLPSGKVLFTAGINVVPGCCYLGMVSAVDIYDPVSGTWSTTGPLASARAGAIAALLANGKVLVAGGGNLSGGIASAEIYDPAAGSWSFTASMASPHGGSATGTLLPNGKVLVAGGDTPAGRASAELYDPISGTWSFTGSLTVGRTSHTASLMAGGKVLVTGGWGASGPPTPTAEIYDVALGTWSPIASMSFARVNSTATVLSDGRVLVAGGSNAAFQEFANGEVWGEAIIPDPVAQTITFASTAPSPAYVGAAYAVTATATSGLPVVLSTSTPATCNISAGIVILSAAGSCSVLANQGGNAAYLPAPQISQSIDVVRRPQAIAFTSVAPTLPLVGETYMVSATASSGLSVGLSSLTPATCAMAGSAVTFAAAGPCTIAANQGGDATYLAAPEQTQALTVITVSEATQNVIAAIGAMNLPAGVENSLSAPLNNLNADSLSAACGKLNAFINQVTAKLGSGQITGTQAAQLLQAANAIKASLRCA